MASSCDPNLDTQPYCAGNDVSADESYIIMDLPPHSPFTLDTPYSERSPPLNEEKFLTMFDSDGRLVQERQLRKAVFLGGIQPSLRKSVWPFLFGMYPCQSTKREREIIKLEYVIKYHEMKAHCLHVLNKLEAAAAKANTGDQDIDDNIMSEEFYNEDNSPNLNLVKSPSSGDETSWITVNMDSSVNSNETVRSISKSPSQSSLSEEIFTDTSKFYSSCTVCGQPLDSVEKMSSFEDTCSGKESSVEHFCTCFHSLSSEVVSPTNDLGGTQSSSKDSELNLEDIAAAVAEAEAKRFQTNVFKSDLISSGLSLDWNSPDVQKQINFIDFQAQIYAKKQKVQRKKFWGMRIIKRDVPRLTVTNHELFREDDSKYLEWLRNMLTTYTYFHREVGYTQGMNDIAASFLSTFQNEPLAYWCFQSYMESVKEEFKEDGLVRKMDKVQQLLNEVDAEVRRHLTEYQLSMVCCQRWLVVGFKREFDLEDSLKCFEIINSRHLELTAVETELIRRKDCKFDSDDFGGTLRMVSSMDKPPYSFDIFMCAALLLELREEIFNWTSLEDIYVGMNSIKINLDDAIKKGEQLFHHYCKKMVDDCFLEVNPGLSSKAL
ncbi:LOW QUALITY PROTEIN: small G protein signaling modulator 1-like [Octopus sinensis]|uniref:LOW QUALITY PROTEIN: small G protein signaling modulator 1-like n=1 Tax=Octopus sinensis TaxID=2607531 RepID=A0A7E6EI48_9MOLL|nr:LOW QUALITY PROTEIN: small G protein signaling modulator 1-like [Octopus sinensis]